MELGSAAIGTMKHFAVFAALKDGKKLHIQQGSTNMPISSRNEGAFRMFKSVKTPHVAKLFNKN